MSIRSKKKIRFAFKLLLILYLAALAYVCLISEQLGRQAGAGYRYNLIPFREISRFYTYKELVGFSSFMLNLFGNILVFIPFGFILPIILIRRRKLFNVILSTFFLSLMIETIQLFLRVGAFDVDDLILNTLGGVIGYILFLIINCIRRSYGKRNI